MPLAPTIWIAIPTFRRPGQLRHLLESLASVVQRDDVQLLVADNDPVGQEGAAVAHAMQDDPHYPLPIHILHVPEPGLCSVRNAIVATALADPAMAYLAMIDDDEWPQPGWLDALLACQALIAADAVAGPVDPHFVTPPPPWAREALVFRPEDRATGDTDMLWASNNLLLTRKALERLPAPWFDPRFNRTGGEDLDYLSRLRDAGARFGWGADARVSEWVMPDRVRLFWVLSRMWRIGFTETLTRRRHRPGPIGILTLFGRTLAVFAMRTAGLLALFLPGARRVDIAGQWVKCWGRLYALTGRGSRAYYGAE